MTAQLFLERPFALAAKIESDKMELAELRQMATGLGSPGLGAMHNPNTPTEANFTKAVEKIDKLEKLIDAEIARMATIKDEIRDAVDQIDNEDEKKALRFRYLHLQSLSEVTVNMGCGERWTRTLIRRGERSVDVYLASKASSQQTMQNGG